MSTQRFQDNLVDIAECEKHLKVMWEIYVLQCRTVNHLHNVVGAPNAFKLLLLLPLCYQQCDILA